MNLDAYNACIRHFGLKPTPYGSKTTTVFIDATGQVYTVPKGELLTDEQRLATIRDFAAVHGFDLPSNLLN